MKLLSVEHFIDSYNCLKKMNLETCAIYLKCQKNVIQDFEQNIIFNSQNHMFTIYFIPLCC